jgi:hypothetical protein
MTRSIQFFGLLFVAFVTTLAACDPSGSVGDVTIGLTSDLRAGPEVTRLEIRMTVDGELLSERNLSLVGPAPDVLFPAEFTFENVAHGAALQFHVRAFEHDDLRVDRIVETTGVAARHLLLRLHLESLCTLFPATVHDPQPSAPTCEKADQTCIAGACASTAVVASSLEDYAENWSEHFADDCKPLGAGDPIVLVGQGQTDYLPMEDDEIALVEAGPQGGHHIWVAMRIKNLHKSGSITSVGGEIPDLGLSIPPLKVVFTLDLDEGSYCKLYGLRFQIDIAGDDVDTMLGKRLKVKVEIKDVTGDVGLGERWVILSDTVI